MTRRACSLASASDSAGWLPTLMMLAGRGRVTSPTLFDLGTLLAVWTAAILVRDNLGRWSSILIWLLVAGLLSTGFTALRRAQLPKKPLRRTGGLPLQGAGPFGRAWRTWKSFAHEMGNYQGRVLMALFYFAIVTPFAVLLKVFSDPLKVHDVPDQSSWAPRSDGDTTIEQARRQF